MFKVVTGIILGIVLTGVATFFMAGSLMFNEVQSPFGVEETAARIQRNIQGLADKGWSLSGLRSPSIAVAVAGSNVLPVLLIEACSTTYSAPLLKEDSSRILSILMPCTITVFKKDDGKTYIGTMNAGLMGSLFGSKVAKIMGKVAEDQAIMLSFDPDKPAPPLIRKRPGSEDPNAEDTGGC